MNVALDIIDFAGDMQGKQLSGAKNSKSQEVYSFEDLMNKGKVSG